MRSAASHAWPFDDHLKRLRRRYQQVRRLGQEIEQLGRYLAKARKMWPRDANEVAKTGFAWITAVEARVEKLRR